MSTMNTFQILAKKKLLSLADKELMRNDTSFALDLARLLLKYGCSETELLELLNEFRENSKHNDIEQKNKTYVYSRFNQFDENLNWLSRVTKMPERKLKLFANV